MSCIRSTMTKIRPVERELNVYMSEESYQLVATQEENAIVARDQAEAMWKDCEAALAEQEGLKLDMMDIKTEGS